jgi:hypothetical protein
MTKSFRALDAGKGHEFAGIMKKIFFNYYNKM